MQLGVKPSPQLLKFCRWVYLEVWHENIDQMDNRDRGWPGLLGCAGWGWLFGLQLVEWVVGLDDGEPCLPNLG
jgi:hypothetical protein